jgi:predicted DNA-binding transcriptional regulator AlpA
LSEIQKTNSDESTDIFDPTHPFSDLITVSALNPLWDRYAIAINKGDPMEALETDCLLHPAEVARILQVSISWLAKTRLSGTGPTYVKIGRSVRYPAASVRDFIKARTRTSTSGS